MAEQSPEPHGWAIQAPSGRNRQLLAPAVRIQQDMQQCKMKRQDKAFIGIFR
jgi:hypothetical protein